MSIINGLVIPGGAGTLRPGNHLYDTATYLLDLAMDANDRGIHFPVHGTCLGIELMGVAVSRNYSLLDKYASL
eukprot:jgi/Chrzof1/8829/Cz03g25310.t1